MKTKSIQVASNLLHNTDTGSMNLTQNSPKMEILHDCPESCNSNAPLSPESAVLVPRHLCASEDAVDEKESLMNFDSQENIFDEPTEIKTFDAIAPIQELSPPTLIPISKLSDFVDEFWTNNISERCRELSPPVLTPVSPLKEEVPTSSSPHEYEYDISNTNLPSTMFNENGQTDCTKGITKSPLSTHFPICTEENASSDIDQYTIKFSPNVTGTNEDFGKITFPHVAQDPKTFPEQTFMPVQEEPLNLTVSSVPLEREAYYQLHMHQYFKSGKTVKLEEKQETFQKLPRHFLIGPNPHFTNYLPDATTTTTEIEPSLYLHKSSLKYGFSNANIPFSTLESNIPGPREVATPSRAINHPRTFPEHVPLFEHNYVSDSLVPSRTPCLNIRKNNAVLSNLEISQSLPVSTFKPELADDVSCHFVSLPSYPRTLTVHKKSAFKPIKVRKYRALSRSYYQTLLNRQGQNVYKHCLQNPYRHRRVVVLKVDSSKPKLSCIQYLSLTSSVQAQNTAYKNKLKSWDKLKLIK